MEISMLMMYFIIMLTNINILFLISGAVSGAILLLAVFSHIIGEELIVSKRFIKIMCVGCIFSLLCATIIPTTKQMAAIIVLPSIINNEQVQQIPEQLLDLSLDWMEELKPKGTNREE